MSSSRPTARPSTGNVKDTDAARCRNSSSGRTYTNTGSPAAAGPAGLLRLRGGGGCMLPAPFCCFCCFCCCCWVLLDGPALSSPAGSGSLYTRVSRMKHLNLNALRRSCTAAAAIAAALVDVCYWRQSAVHRGGSALWWQCIVVAVHCGTHLRRLILCCPGYLIKQRLQQWRRQLRRAVDKALVDDQASSR